MNIAISIYVNGDIVGLRKWPAVPRMGDIIMLGNGGPKLTPHRVVEVVWLTGADNECHVHLSCREIKTK